MLGLFVLDVVESVIPVQWMNPAWELQVIGAMVERSPVPLIGIVLFFYGDGFMRSRWTWLLSRVLSWMALVVGAGLLLTLPLMVADTSRLIKRVEVQVTGQMQQQALQSDRVMAEVEGASAASLTNLLTRMGRVMEGQTEAEARDALLGELRKTREEGLDRARQMVEEQKFILMKRSWKWGVQSVLVAFVLIYTWRQSGWARARFQLGRIG